MKLLPVLSFILLLSAVLGTCAPPPEPVAEGGAVAIIKRAVTAHGMDGFDDVRAGFTFRERQYSIDRKDGRYLYTRSFTDSLGNHILDELSNDGLSRTRNDSLIGLTEKDSAAYAGSVNSVRYFFMLPYGLYDPAVNTQLLDPVSIDGKPYDRVQVTFDAAGGGRDHDDIYRYFFNQETGELDFLAYTFAVNEGGIRFRKAINKRRVNGVLVQDYVNYGVDGDDRAIEGIEDRYSAGELPELSVIENTGVRIE